MVAIAPHTNNVTAPAATDNNNDNVSTALNTLESHRSTGEDDESPDDVVDIAVGGGEAPGQSVTVRVQNSFYY